MTSTTGSIGALDPADPTPLHEQAAAEIRRAAVLGVNRNTVLRALRLLRDEGLLEFRRGRGITVTGTPQRSALLASARDLVALARQNGYHRDELINIIKSLP